MSCCQHPSFIAIPPRIFPLGAAAFKRAVGSPPTDLDLAPGNKVSKKPGTGSRRVLLDECRSFVITVVVQCNKVDYYAKGFGDAPASGCRNALISW